MTRNSIFTRPHAWAEVLRDPVPMIDHCVTVLMLALLLCLLGSITLAAEREIPRRHLTCTADAFKCCDELIRNAECTPAHLSREIGAPDPEYPVATTTVGRKG